MRENDALMTVAKRLRSEFVVGVSGVVQRRSPDTVNPEARHRRGRECSRARSACSTKRRRRRSRSPKTARCRKTCGSSYRYLDLRRPRLQHNIGLRHRVSIAIRKYFDANGFWEIETPILAQVDAGGRARLPRAEPRPPRRVLRAAAVAADLQADPDDRRHRSLLPDRRAASATRISAPTGSSSSRRSTSRCRSRSPRRSTASSSR